MGRVEGSLANPETLGSAQTGRNADAEPPGRHSHGDRGNE